MRKKILLLPLCLLAISCISLGGSTKKNTIVVEPTQPTYYDYRVEATYPHKIDSYTQGLIYHDGRLLEGTGQVGESRLLGVDLESGETELISELQGSHFGEGITILGDSLYQLTWITNRLFIYSATTGEKIGEKIYAGEGWGLTTDGEKLYMSDGSSIITRRNPQTFDIEKRILVKINGEPLDYLNELEWINGKIWANVYTTDVIVIIDPESGEVEGVVDLTGILADEHRGATTDVLNGIAYDSEGDRVFVTGKNWSKLFEIKIEKR